jgi:hypothetical protein
LTAPAQWIKFHNLSFRVYWKLIVIFRCDVIYVRWGRNSTVTFYLSSFSLFFLSQTFSIFY